MVKTATVRARVDEQLKADVEVVLDSLGLSVSEAINLYLAQIRLHRGIPFDLRIPNDETLKAFEESDQEQNLTRAKNADDMFKKLDI